MLPSEIDTGKTKKTLFLVEPSKLLELDGWIADYIQRQERFTFDEQEVLLNLWQEGEDVRLREDGRFRQILFPLQEGIEAQWYLAIHILANQHLYELLLDELWDGRNLYQCLEDCDKDDKNGYHVLCPNDTRFHLFKDERGVYCVSLCEQTTYIALTAEQKAILDQLAPQLLNLAMNERGTPYTTICLLETLQKLFNIGDALRGMLPQALENWLLCQKDWVRVGRDSWFLKSNLPTLSEKHRYAVSPVFSPSEGSKTGMPQLVKENVLGWEATQILEETADPEESTANQKHMRWQIALRTCHINEGAIPVPKQARALYPHAIKLADIVAISGIWVIDGRDTTIWLDRKKHRFFGPDLEEQFAYFESGTILEVKWKASGLIFNTLHIDTQIADEETRLIDLTSLSQSRSYALESYRTSIRMILSESNIPLNFRDLYEQLCVRQQHKPNSSTIRSILSSSSEFIFDKATKKWMLNASTNPEIGAKLLRSSTMLARQIKDSADENQENQQKPPSLTQLIARNRQQLTVLRSLYLQDKRKDPPS